MPLTSIKEDESRPTKKHKSIREGGEKAVERLLYQHEPTACFTSEPSVLEMFQNAPLESFGEGTIYGVNCPT